MMVVKKGDAAKIGSGVRQSIQLLEVGGRRGDLSVVELKKTAG
jgi:hypothetical protein